MRIVHIANCFVAVDLSSSVGSVALRCTVFRFTDSYADL